MGQRSWHRPRWLIDQVGYGLDLYEPDDPLLQAGPFILLRACPMTCEAAMRQTLILSYLILTGCTSPNPDFIAGAHRIFVSASLHESTVVLSSKLCDSEALAAGLVGTWIPWVSSAAVDFDRVNAIDQITAQGPWIDINNNIIFPNRNSLASVPDLPLEIDQYGNKVAKDAPIWTGTAPGGVRSNNFCFDKYYLQVWTSRLPDVYGDIGKVGRLDSNWTYAGGLPCSERAHVICFEQ